MEKRKKRRFRTFTKRAVMGILFVALLDLQLSYLLAFLGREQIAENLSSDITKVIIGTILGYLAKSFFETKEAEKVRLEEEWRNGE
jgi:putative flippase GtrA